MTSMYNSLKDKSQKQVLLVRIWFHLLHQMRASVRTEVFILLQRNIKAKTGLEEAVVNQVTVWPESGADRAAVNRESPVLFLTPNQYNPNRIFQIGNGFGFFLIFLSQRYNTLDLASRVSVQGAEIP